MLKHALLAMGALLLAIVVTAAGAGGMLSTLGGQGAGPSAYAAADIPADYLLLYRQAATTCPGLDWSVPAAIGKVETDHGRSTLPGVHNGTNYAGARGPMQFLGSTFAQVIAKHPLPRFASHMPSPYDPRDSIYAAVALLCDAGARNKHDLQHAIFAYNHANWYVAKVLAVAQSYRRSSPSTSSAAALQAVNYATGQLGLPYVWGGNGPTAGDAGFDCSGLTKEAYASAHIVLPRTAQQQFDAGPRVAGPSALSPGDLVFYGHSSNGIHHVGLYIGEGQVIDAPAPGTKIRIEPYRYPGDDYAGATRPAT
ncbi:NlpC/P60 family protein [Streptomyces coacervatus]|uniref:NlpC/P60 family protein n=1 Tax=Streptomyces coacervatus TaxID=647381 RepID=A0ABP7J9M4_9ACTN|nr:C40 family peptidase [Streptomyces coacervatus]MDF2270273.1 C40 family peptidase [Streptomyces coacervatus]